MSLYRHAGKYFSSVSRSLTRTRIPHAPLLSALLLVFGCGAPHADTEALGQSQAPLTFNAIGRESVTSGGGEGNAVSSLGSVSSNGRFVTFFSRATNLVANDFNAQDDVFRRDRDSGALSLVSVSSAGVQGNGPSGASQPSADGRFVVFESSASNLVANDTNFSQDIFLRDTQAGQTTRVSVSSAGVQGNSISFSPSISADGRFIAYSSLADNLVPGDTNGAIDVFVYNRLTAQTTRVSVSSAGVQGNGFSATGLAGSSALSADGSVVVFESVASNLVLGDNNSARDIFTRNLLTGQTVRVSVSSAGVQSNSDSRSASISGNGQFVAFSSGASNFATGDLNATFDIFVRNLGTNTTTLESRSSAGVIGNGFSEGVDISDDGRFVGFTSNSSNLVPGDTNGDFDTFVRDRTLGSTIRVNISNGGAQANQASNAEVSLSGNGSLVVFSSGATNLVTDLNFFTDVFGSRIGL